MSPSFQQFYLTPQPASSRRRTPAPGDEGLPRSTAPRCIRRSPAHSALLCLNSTHSVSRGMDRKCSTRCGSSPGVMWAISYVEQGQPPARSRMPFSARRQEPNSRWGLHRAAGAGSGRDFLFTLHGTVHGAGLAPREAVNSHPRCPTGTSPEQGDPRDEKQMMLCRAIARTVGGRSTRSTPDLSNAQNTTSTPARSAARAWRIVMSVRLPPKAPHPQNPVWIKVREPLGTMRSLS